MKPPVITLLTDFGSVDHYVAAMKGVALGICPGAQLVDVCHGIPPYAITEAAFTLAQAWPCFPKGTVHLVVVDPGVGSSRRPILAQAAGHYFVAPDNGVLSLVFEAAPKHKVREITGVRYFRQPVSHTFHGRDIFAPAAAHLAAGVAPARFGKVISDYVQPGFAKPVRSGAKTWAGSILKIERFGNLITNFKTDTFPGPFELKSGSLRVHAFAANYAEMKPGELFTLAGSAGYLEISINQGSAADAVGARAGSAVELRLL